MPTAHRLTIALEILFAVSYVAQLHQFVQLHRLDTQQSPPTKSQNMYSLDNIVLAATANEMKKKYIFLRKKLLSQLQSQN